jgi:alpha-glucosidase
VYGEQITNIIKKYLQLRYQLLPYIYTTAWQASRYGFPLMRPLFWKAERNKKLLDIEDEYFFGDKLLVAPILNEGSRRRDVLLPEGKWVDFWTDRWFDGNRMVNVNASLSTIPLFVKEGSVLAMETDQTMTIHLYVPGFDDEKEFESFLYSDSGDGYGEWRVDRFKVRWENGELTLDHEFEGDYQLPYDLIMLKLHGARGIKAKINSCNIKIENNLIKLPKLESVTFLIEPLDVYN